MPGNLPMSSLAEAIVETITQPLLVLDGELRVEAANGAFLQHFEVEPAETLGCLVYDLGNGQWNIAGLRRLLEEVLSEDGTVVDYRVEYEFESIGERVMLLNGNRMRQEGTTDTILLAITDITERERLRFELEGQKEFAEKLIDGVRESLVVLGWDLEVHFANQSFYRRFAATREGTEGRLIYELGNGQWDIPELRVLLEEILPRDNNFDDYEVEHEFESIGKRTMLLNGRRLDHMNLVLLVIRDVTEQRKQEFRQHTLMGELQHRVKNILSLVHALATQTRKRSRGLDDFFTAYEARLGALARVQDLLVMSPSGTVHLRDIVRPELEAVGAENGRNFTFEGPLVPLPSREAQTMAMTIHELTTNAAKYGALRTDNGRIEIRWRTDRRNDRTYLTFEWRERGVRIDELAPTWGFGTKVIEQSFPHMLGGTTELIFNPDGVACRLEFPLPVRARESYDG
jgi:two-component sensor histidine kinase/PAS domain-containing protein